MGSFQIFNRIRRNAHSHFLRHLRRFYPTVHQGWRVRRAAHGFHQPVVREPDIHRAVLSSPGKIPDGAPSRGHASRPQLQGIDGPSLSLKVFLKDVYSIFTPCLSEFFVFRVFFCIFKPYVRTLSSGDCIVHNYGQELDATQDSCIRVRQEPRWNSTLVTKTCQSEPPTARNLPPVATGNTL